MRSGATSSRQPRRRLVATGLVLLAGLAAGGAVVVVREIERDLDRRITRSLRDAGFGEVAAPIRVQDGVYRTQTLGLWLAGLLAAALIGLVLGLLAGRRRRRPVDADDAALLRQGWRIETMAPAGSTPVATHPSGIAEVAVIADVHDSDDRDRDDTGVAAGVAAGVVAGVRVPPPIPVPPISADPVSDALVFEVGPLVDPRLSVSPGAPARASSAVTARSRASLVPPPERDDLTAISGVDAEVAALLRANGYGTWERLGVAEVGELRRLLDLEGPRFRPCQPGTWPIQARLLAAGEWSAWRALVDGLRDGRPIWR